jgi:hypothetical protein
MKPATLVGQQQHIHKRHIMGNVHMETELHVVRYPSSPFVCYDMCSTFFLAIRGEMLARLEYGRIHAIQLYMGERACAPMCGFGN